MHKADMMVLGLAGLACWFILQGKKTIAGKSTANSYNVVKAAPDYQGWQYFSDGTAISPDGAYYQNGQLVWQPS